MINRISDHDPVVHHQVLFWNIMMQGKKRRQRNTNNVIGYNNAFGLIETDQDYIKRLKRVVTMITEITNRYPSMQVIGICEGPIQDTHVNAFLTSFSDEWRERFYLASQPTNWGLFVFANQNYIATEIQCETMSVLTERYQVWLLQNGNHKFYFTLGHFPFGNDEHKTEKTQLSANATDYCNLINRQLTRHAHDELIICADFNFNPYLINRHNDRYLDNVPGNNSMLLTDNTLQSVTVDGILLSTFAKQKHDSTLRHVGLFKRLMLEDRLSKSSENENGSDLTTSSIIY